MAITKYKIVLFDREYNAKIYYKNGRLSKIEFPDKLHPNPLYHQEIMRHVPMFETGIQNMIDKEGIQFKVLTPPTHTLHQQCMEQYLIFFQRHTGVLPKISPSEKKNLNEIIAYLKTIVIDENSVLKAWQTILSAIPTLDNKFLRSQIQLRQINNYLNNIINEVSIKNKEQKKYSDLRNSF